MGAELQPTKITGNAMARKRRFICDAQRPRSAAPRAAGPREAPRSGAVGWSALLGAMSVRLPILLQQGPDAVLFCNRTLKVVVVDRLILISFKEKDTRPSNVFFPDCSQAVVPHLP